MADEEYEEDEIDLDSIEDEQTLIQLLDETEDIDERKRIRDRLRKVQFEIKAQREERRQQLEDARENKIRNKVKEADERKKKTLDMYDQMSKAKTNKPTDGSAKPRDLVEDAIQDRLKAAEDRKKRIMAAYDHASKSQPGGGARIVEFDAFKSADVSKLEEKKPVVKGSCTFGMSGGVSRNEKVAAPVAPRQPIDDSHLDPMERAIRARVREADERKRRTLAAYDQVARSGGSGPKVVIMEELNRMDISDEPKKTQRYDPCFGGLRT